MHDILYLSPESLYDLGEVGAGGGDSVLVDEFHSLGVQHGGPVVSLEDVHSVVVGLVDSFRGEPALHVEHLGGGRNMCIVYYVLCGIICLQPNYHLSILIIFQ